MASGGCRVRCQGYCGRVTSMATIDLSVLRTLLAGAGLPPALVEGILVGRQNFVEFFRQSSGENLAQTLSIKYSIARRQRIEVTGGDMLVSALRAEQGESVL